jgi:transcriptional regulator with XRE-family HTH domain
VLLSFIATRLRELRRRHDLTQEQMALMLETDIKWYQRIESGLKDIKASTIERFAAVFGVSAVQFLGEQIPETKVQVRTQKPPHRPKRKASAARKEKTA